jgi:hypothetical protein
MRRVRGKVRERRIQLCTKLTQLESDVELVPSTMGIVDQREGIDHAISRQLLQIEVKYGGIFPFGPLT